MREGQKKTKRKGTSAVKKGFCSELIFGNFLEKIVKKESKEIK